MINIGHGLHIEENSKDKKEVNDFLKSKFPIIP